MKYIELKPPVFTSYFEIVMSGMSGQTVCEKFEIYGCSGKSLSIYSIFLLCTVLLLIVIIDSDY